MTEFIYVFIRKDIPLAQQILQACHACVLAGREYRHGDETHLILLQIKDESQLWEVVNLLCDVNIKSQMFYEPDLYKGRTMGYTAIATEIVQEDQRQIFSEFKLWHKTSLISHIRKLISRIGLGN